MAGLVTRVVWIYPSWVDSIDEVYTKCRMELGYRQVIKDGKTVPYFCECQTILDPDEDKDIALTDKECMYIDYSKPGDKLEISLPADECKTVKSITMEYVKDDWALQMAKQPQWLANTRSVILDIDEDFYGVENVVDPLLASGFQWPVLTNLSQRISQFLCPLNAEDEGWADNLLKQILAATIRLCKWSSQHRMCTSSMTSIKEETYRLIQEKFLGSNQAVFCGSTLEKVKTAWDDILSIVTQLSTEQVRALTQTGFCLNMSPSTLNFEEVAAFRICHGVNTPNDTLVDMHTVTSEEVQETSDNLKLLLTALQAHHPHLVTISRSLRDGFTPRQFARDIEAGILSYFDTYSGPGKGYQIIYDGSLLGGRQGRFHT